MAEIPVISNRILHGMPAFLRREIGQRALLQANRAIGFDLELTEGENCFIPHAAVIRFVEAAARAAGEANFGILIAPMMDVANYGSFGHYVIGADNLGQAIERSITGLCYHSTDDRMSVAILGDEVRYSYVFALAGCAGYANVACAAAGVLLSLFRAYLPRDWRPMRIELDIDRPRQTGLLEDVFQCPVHFNAPAVTVVMDRHHLSAAPRHAASPIVTLEDVARDRRGGAPRDLLDVIMEQIRAQVLTGSVSLESAAQLTDTSVRTLQRELARAGTDFRSLASAARVQRATELLRHTNGSITRVAAELGYSSPANFARAFRKATGGGPREFRSNLQQIPALWDHSVT
ncbi:AraC family transcriptional regulator [Rhizobiaceae bacterium n13]|uniref:AraC family transcriptional regulator n=1 Tax=Ferirhizobium litorale TaxID=2927786 RepID=A0AAE3QDL5_9HYPH|nr:AraC family transcriptional regulator ligand-binding domain-containing protein [Fererhizobium litorale]MDI7862660.1 AraC family transcriptional regulator [Fererhizobium litorale]MDI7923857.1 AraC family transcriptional regulator [Fererhizobium litorale]